MFQDDHVHVDRWAALTQPGPASPALQILWGTTSALWAAVPSSSGLVDARSQHGLQAVPLLFQGGIAFTFLSMKGLLQLF